jgi:hypothetical protein
MKEQRPYKFMSNGNEWANELFFIFVAGFLLATLFWLGLYFYQARPAQADALQAQETTLREADARLRQCRAEEDRLGQLNQRLEAEVSELDQKLRQAWLAYGRCTQEAK